MEVVRVLRIDSQATDSKAGVPPHQQRGQTWGPLARTTPIS